MKIKFLLVGVLSTLTLGAATTAGVLAFQKENQPVEEFVEAEEAPIRRLNLDPVASGKKRIILDCTSYPNYDNEQGKSIALHYWGSSDNYVVASKASDNFWYVDINASGVTGFQFLRCDTNNPSNRYNWQNDSTSADNNYYFVTGWDKSGTWSTVETNWKLYISDTSGNNWGDGMSFTQSKLDSDGLQYYSTSVELKAGQKFKIYSGSVWLGFNKLGTYNNTSANEKGYLTGNGDSDITVAKSATLEIYIKPYAQTLWAQISSEEEAKAYATDFVAQMTCSGAGSVTAANGTWGTFSTRFTNNLTQGARDLLKTATANENGTILEQCAARYDEIIAKHGTTQYPNFMNRNVSTGAGSRALNAFSGAEAAVPATVAVVGMVSMTAVGGFFFLKKKPF